MTVGIVGLPADFPARLRGLREQRYLTQTDLALRAEISPRSVHELESGRRDRAQVQTIMRLARVLEVTYAELLHGQAEAPGAGDPAGSGPAQVPPAATATAKRRRGRIVLAAAALLLAAAILGIVAGAARRKVEVRAPDGIVEARGALSGRLLWRQNFLNEILCWRVSPWDDDILLVGLTARTTGGGRLVALDLRDGRKLWDVVPDLDPLARAFEPQFVYSGAFNCREIPDADLDGDGRREIIAHFCHNKWFPSVICVVDRDGAVESQYANRGHVYDVLVADTDSDGRDEIICAGTNNAPAYDGATIFILDDGHRTGAAIDPLTSPGSAVRDSSLVRIVIPLWPEAARQALGTRERIAAFDARTFDRTDGTVGLQANIGHQKDHFFIVAFDAELRPTLLEISDHLQAAFARGGAGQARWDRAWLDGHLRFERGLPVAPSPLP